MSNLPDNVFRAGVGAMVVSEEGEVLAFERFKIPGAWQLPQGGLEEGEHPRDCVLRELEEETGLSAEHVELLAETPGWHAYELPCEMHGKRHGRGQAQKWFLFRFKGPEAAIQLDRQLPAEFRAWQWMTLDELIGRSIEFRRPVYRALAEAFASYLASGG